MRMDPIGFLGEIIIRSIFLTLTGALLLDKLADITKWLLAYRESGQLPGSQIILYFFFCMLTTAFSVLGIIVMYRQAVQSWRAVRSRVTEPWTGLRIIQPQKNGSFFASTPPTYEDGQGDHGGQSRESAATGIDTAARRGQGLGQAPTPSLTTAGHSIGAHASKGESCWKPRQSAVDAGPGSQAQHRPSGTLQWRSYVEDVDDDE